MQAEAAREESSNADKGIYKDEAGFSVFRTPSSRCLLQHVVSQTPGAHGVTAEQILRFKDHVAMLAEGKALDAKRCAEELQAAEQNLQGWKQRVAEPRNRIAQKEEEMRENLRILQLLRAAYEGRLQGGGHG